MIPLLLTPNRKAMDTKTSIQQKRDELKKVSAIAKELVKGGEFNTINEGIIGIYTNETHQHFKTLPQWNEAGYKVKRGEKAFLVWGKPKGRKNAEAKAEPSEEESNFFPIAFVFSNAQVEPAK